jgi:hypothetical protein
MTGCWGVAATVRRQSTERGRQNRIRERVRERCFIESLAGLACPLASLATGVARLTKMASGFGDFHYESHRKEELLHSYSRSIIVLSVQALCVNILSEFG